MSGNAKSDTKKTAGSSKNGEKGKKPYRANDKFVSEALSKFPRASKSALEVKVKALMEQIAAHNEKIKGIREEISKINEVTKGSKVSFRYYIFVNVFVLYTTFII